MRPKERLLMWFIWKLPRSFVYWCTIRLFAWVSTTDEFKSTEIGSIKIFDALERWDKNGRNSN